MRTKLLILTFLLYNISWAQQEPQFTQYMYNTMSINPAYAGSRGVTSIFGMHRTQWIGVDGAPTTNNISLHTPLNDSNVGLGFAIINDKIGPSIENDIAANFSYAITVNDDYKLAFGLKASLNILDVDFGKLAIYDPSDPRFEQNIDKRLAPNIGTGIYLHSEKSYLGISAPNMLEMSHFDRSEKDKADGFIVKEQQSYYLMAGHVLDLSYNWKFKPSMLARVIRGAPLQLDLSANFLFNEKFTGGLSYRLNAAVSAMAGFQISDSFFVGYSYDAETTKLASYNSGSHEIFLRFEIFGRSNSKLMSTRFF